MDAAAHELAAHFAALELPPDAAAWLLDVWCLIQTLDDVADGDPVDRPSLDAALWAALVTMPANPFYVANMGALQGAMATQLLKWQAADQAERAGLADARSFMWRAGYYDLILLVVLLTKGQASAKDKAMTVMHLYGETMKSYVKEFPPCPSR